MPTAAAAEVTTSVRSTDVTAIREGLELILTVNGTNEQIRVIGEFIGIKPGLFGGNLNDKKGVQQIVFSDGVVWNKPDISWAVSHPDPTDQVILGTPDMDVLDGGTGGAAQYPSGGDGGDVYVFGPGYGHDTVEDKVAWILNTAPDYVKSGPGISMSDLTWSHQGNSNDLNSSINGTDDQLTILSQFSGDYNIFGKMWLNRIESFSFDDGTMVSW